MTNFYDWNLKEKYYKMASDVNKKFIETRQFKKMLSFIEEVFSGKDKINIAEFWCGEWWKLLPFNNDKFTISWFDISSYALKIAKNNIPKGNFYNHDITKTIDFKEKYDVSMSFFALEHIPNPLAAIDNMINSLKEWWYLILRYPNYGSFLFPSPPLIYRYKFHKAFLILGRLIKRFYKSTIYDNVIPVEDNYEKPDYDVTTELHMKATESYIINQWCKLIYHSSCREEIKGLGNYCKLLPNGKYIGPQSFFIFQK